VGSGRTRVWVTNPTEWGLLLQANQAGEMQPAVADGANDVLSAYAVAAGTAVPKIAALIQTPARRPLEQPALPARPAAVLEQAPPA